MVIRYALAVLVALALAAGRPAVAAPSLVENVDEGVTVVRDDNAQWGGISMGMTHMNNAGYQAKKILDLSAVPEATWNATKEIRLSAYFCVRDYSAHASGKVNGLDEAFEVTVNGKKHTYPTNCGAPDYNQGKGAPLDWYDFALPKEEFVRGLNEILFQKAPTEKGDDYFYLGIDNSIERGNSFVSLAAGQPWTNEKLTVPGGKGEYMVRLYLISRERRAECVWRPGAQPAVTGPAGVLLYAGARGAAPTTGLTLGEKGREARVEWDARRLDAAEPVTVVVETPADARYTFRWLGMDGKPSAPVAAAGPRFEVHSGDLRARGLALAAGAAPLTVNAVTVRGSLGYHPVEQGIDMRPAIAKPAGAPAARKPACRVEAGAVVLENAGLRCRFATKGRLSLVSLVNEIAGVEMARQPEKVDLFLVEVAGKRYSGSRDFQCRGVRPAGKGQGFVADLVLPEPALAATLAGSVDAEGVRLGLSLANRGTQPVDFKVAFPHMSGLALSKEPAADYYYFPWGGGVIADCAAVLRRGYGDHAALYQVMDLFSPALGAGLSLRADDSDGRYKVMALRKSIPGQAERGGDQAITRTAPEFLWQNSLPAVTGTGFACEYLRRTRAPGQAFVPAPAVLSAHAGDWHTALKAYAAWSHRVWKFRPYPSRLDNVVNMIADGWGQGILFKDGQYRDNVTGPRKDCVELMSWWDWSPLGPWNTPIDQVAEKLGEAKAREWAPYFVKDPVTGKMMWNNQPGDYDGYNERFGGLPAFRQAIQKYKKAGALVTLYTDPIRCDDNTKIGRAHGKEWGVVQPDGEHVKNYDVWNMCHDVAEYRQWVADAMKRVMRETGADGLRLDEYGHMGWACFSKLHKHTFEEPGCTEWQRAIAETCKLVRRAMDEVDPKSVLTTEHPGHDYEMQFLDGCITYDLTVQQTPLRPLECNTQRFYFPECKAYELDHRGADRTMRKRFWNMVTSFGAVYPQRMHDVFLENRDVLNSAACEPLVPSLMQYVYANRFGAAGKALWTVYNATGHTVDGPVLSVPLGANEHLFDLLNGEECLAQVAGGQARVSAYLAPDDVVCVARLPRLLSVARQGDLLVVSIKGAPAGARVVVLDAEAKVLATAPAAAKVTFAPDALQGGTPHVVKVLAGGRLLDAAGL